jgi:hypothetical protein
MGYSTRYTLTTTPASDRTRVLDAIKKAVRYDPFGDECKWYEHEADVQRGTSALPFAIITIHGEGEETGDEWIMHALNGIVVKHRMPKWEPPGPDPRWIATVEASEAQRVREATEQRERDLAELQRLRTLYPDA